MDASKHLSHWLSLKCYQNAQKNQDTQGSSVYPKQYEDLESLISLFGMVNSEQPDRFAFLTHAPNLLIVEDEDSLADLLKRTLVERGYPGEAIHLFKWSEEAILFARNHVVGIALVDIFLYNVQAVRNIYISGLQVLGAIKEASPGAKVILISGHAPYEMVYKAILELGASYYLGKPFDVVDIVRIVHWAVERLLGSEMKRIIPPDSTSSEKLPLLM